MSPRLCLLLIVAASWSGVALAQSSQYCRFTSSHTLCLHAGIGETCGNQVQARGVSAQDAALILAQHNQLRSRVAMGQEPLGAPGPQPQAANMRLLEWDDELALVAQSHADQCIFEHECSDCRRVSRFGVGQNLFISFQSNFNTRIQWSRAIRAWYDEVAEFDPNAIQPFQFSTPVGHYTQMMWWNTYKVGCGYTMFREGGWWKKLYTCNYGPGGNIIFSEMYRRGSPCSACPAGTSCSLQYPGLCEDGDPHDSTKVLPRDEAEASAATTERTTPSDNNEAENEIPLIPFTPENTDIDTFNSFNRFNGINSINPNDVDIEALIEFFNSMRNGGSRMPSVSILNEIFNGRKPGLVTARIIASDPPVEQLEPTTQPPASQATTTSSTTTTPSPSTTTTEEPSTTTITTTTTTTPATTTSPSTTTSSSPEGPSTFSTVPSNAVLQQRTGTTPTFRTRLPTTFHPVFQQQHHEEQFEHEFEPQEPQEAQEAEFEPAEAPEPQEQEEQMFIPFHGNQPQTTDLMPFLNRAGMNTQVIRTGTLSSVQSIINSLPLGLKPIVLFRSGTGQLTELDAGTLLPLRRFGRSTTTTRGPKKTPGILVTCDLDVSPCDFTPVGANWTVGDSPSEGRFTQATLEEGEGAQLLYQHLIAAPSTENICIAISHRRDLEEGAHPNATIPELMVGVMPIGGEVIRETLGGAPGLWEMSRVSFSNVKTSFLVVMTIAPASDRATVAVDALQITDGLCCLSGVC